MKERKLIFGPKIHLLVIATIHKGQETPTDAQNTKQKKKQPYLKTLPKIGVLTLETVDAQRY